MRPYEGPGHSSICCYYYYYHPPLFHQTLGLNPEMVGLVFMIPSLLYSLLSAFADRIVLGLGHKKVGRLQTIPPLLAIV